MSTSPTYRDIVALHEKYTPSDTAFNLVFTHSLIVWKLAEQLIGESSLQIDANKVKIGCLLHDIGVYKLFLPNGRIDHKNYIKHGTIGYEILKEEGFDEEICRIALCHTGVGLSREEIIREEIPIFPANYYARTLEEQLVMYADKFHTKTDPPKFITAKTYEKQLLKFGEAKVEYFQALQLKFGVPSLKIIAAMYNSSIV